MEHINRMTKDEIATLAKHSALPLTDDRLEQLVQTLTVYRDNFHRLRQIDVGDSEPPTMTYDQEARS